MLSLLLLSQCQSYSFKDYKSLSNQGFTVVEIFVAIMVIMISLTVALQMFISAAYLRARSQEYGDVYQWVQEDFETVRSQAVSYESAALPYSTACGLAPASNLAANFISTVLGGSSVSLGTRSLAGQDVTLNRTATYATSAAPDRLVELQYSLVPVGEIQPSFEMMAEVVVYAAFRCPN